MPRSAGQGNIRPLYQRGRQLGRAQPALREEVWGVKRRKIRIPVKPLNAILRPLGNVRAIKLDIVGAEFAALSELFVSDAP